jgi:CRISPR-associated protein Csb2
VWPHDTVVHLVWPSASLESGEREALSRMAARVARIGHSASLVRVCVAEDPPKLGRRKRWRPAEEGDLTLRVPLENQRSLLEREHEHHQQVEARILPYRPQAYTSWRETKVRMVTGPFAGEGWIIYEVVSPPGAGRRQMLDLSRAEELSRAFRGALLKASDGNLPETLSGHDASGKPSARPHLAFVPLADVGHQWATGSILGVALIPPRGLDEDESNALMSVLAKLDETIVLRPNRQVAVHVRRRVRPDPRATLREGTWTGPSTRWASVTAVALDRNPGRLNDRDPEVVARAVESAEASVAQSCANVGLPEPVAVFIHKRSLFDGSPPARRFMPFPRTEKGLRRVCVHVELVFDVPVRGPLLLGAGRYFGVGLFRPMGHAHV